MIPDSESDSESIKETSPKGEAKKKVSLPNARTMKTIKKKDQETMLCLLGKSHASIIVARVDSDDAPNGSKEYECDVGKRPPVGRQTGCIVMEKPFPRHQ